MATLGSLCATAGTGHPLLHPLPSRDRRASIPASEGMTSTDDGLVGAAYPTDLQAGLRSVSTHLTTGRAEGHSPSAFSSIPQEWGNKGVEVVHGDCQVCDLTSGSCTDSRSG